MFLTSALGDVFEGAVIRWREGSPFRVEVERGIVSNNVRFGFGHWEIIAKER